MANYEETSTTALSTNPAAAVPLLTTNGWILMQNCCHQVMVVLALTNMALSAGASLLRNKLLWHPPLVTVLPDPSTGHATKPNRTTGQGSTNLTTQTVNINATNMMFCKWRSKVTQPLTQNISRHLTAPNDKRNTMEHPWSTSPEGELQLLLSRS